MLTWLAKMLTDSQWHSCIADVDNRSIGELLPVFFLLWKPRKLK